MGVPETTNVIPAVVGRLGLTPQRYLIYPADFPQSNNHEMLLTAFGMACHQGLEADIKLVCHGAPDARQAWLLRCAHSMNLRDRVFFPGCLPGAQWEILLSHCAGLVYPSLDNGVGLSIIEALDAGVPVACSNTISLPSGAVPAELLFDPRLPTQIAQAIISLAQHNVARVRKGRAGNFSKLIASLKRFARKLLTPFLPASHK